MTGETCRMPLTFADLLSHRPFRMVGRVVKAFRVGHETEDPTGGVADPGDIMQGAVGVFGKTALGRIPVGKGVTQGYLFVFDKALEGRRIGEKLTFPMPNGKLQVIQTLCKNARRSWIDL